MGNFVRDLGEALAKNIPKNRAGRVGLLAAGAVMAVPLVDSFSKWPKQGRGEVIEACPVGFEPKVEVADVQVFVGLGRTATDHMIKDEFAGLKRDFAASPGELACQNESKLVLLPAGEDAAYLSDEHMLSGELPNGLVWVSAPPKQSN